MGDWDEEDWENADIKLPVKAPAAKATTEQTKGEAALATAVNEPDSSKFADEDAEAEPEKDYGVVKSQVSAIGSLSKRNISWTPYEQLRKGLKEAQLITPCN